ncbi:MAG: tRNA (guanosine(37)-N1)-methyltransferase TrmD [Halobacteriovorax sp.]|nr:tRNA (guanosine(37)-N1)-methyltransferase TrmD [Halobacteriovorax sp.]
MKKIWIINSFPKLFEAYLDSGVAGQALRGERGIDFELNSVLLRDFSPKDFKGVDAAPFGGGEGMVIRADVLKNALMEGVVKPGGYGDNFREKLHIVYTSPRGKVWDNEYCKEFSKNVWGAKGKDVVFVCGRYEGIDERFIEAYVDELISLGDFVITGGEVAVLTILDSALRFVPGVLGNKVSSENESFNGGLLEEPIYTRPRDFEGLEVPEILLSGNHKAIKEFKESERLRITKKYRPDLLDD